MQTAAVGALTLGQGKNKHEFRRLNPGCLSLYYTLCRFCEWQTDFTTYIHRRAQIYYMAVFLASTKCYKTAYAKYISPYNLC